MAMCKICSGGPFLAAQKVSIELFGSYGARGPCQVVYGFDGARLAKQDIPSVAVLYAFQPDGSYPKVSEIRSKERITPTFLFQLLSETETEKKRDVNAQFHNAFD